MFDEHMTEFAGYPVVQWNPGDAFPDPAHTIARIACDYEDEQSWDQRFAIFLELPNISSTPGLVVGVWEKDVFERDEESSSEVIATLIAAKDQLPNLKSIFMGDITYDENEISWIYNTDLGPVFEAFPNLQSFGVRGGQNLRFSNLDMPKLHTLIVQSGGLSSEVIQDIMAAKLPSLKHLELYLGAEEYGATSTPEDFAPLLDGKLFPQLAYLGLRDSEIVDALAQLLAHSPIVEQIKTLDLSLGTLSNVGGEALLSSPSIAKLERLDLHHHWLTDEMMARLSKLGPKVDVSEQQDLDDDDWIFVAVGE